VSAGKARQRVPNRLQDHRVRLGLNRVEAAERIAALAAETKAEEIGLDAHQMARHERGVHKPGKLYRGLYCRFYQATEDELWPRPHTHGRFKIVRGVGAAM